MDILFEQKVVQNAGLAAEAIWQAVNERFESGGRTAGVSLPLAFLVLPLSFHRRTALALATKTQPGALYKALADDREITVGLQTRMQAMADRTFQALSIAFQSGLLLLDPDHERHLIPGRRGAPVSHVTDEVRTILAAAKRVGHPRAVSDPAVPEFGREWDLAWEQNLLHLALEELRHEIDERQFQIFDLYVIKGSSAGRVAKLLGISVARVYLAKYRVSALVKQRVRRLQRRLTMVGNDDICGRTVSFSKNA